MLSELKRAIRQRSRSFLGRLLGLDLTAIEHELAEARRQRADGDGPGELPSELQLLTAARAIAADPDFDLRMPFPANGERRDPENLRIGLYGNVANNLYIMAKCLRRLGYQMNRPFWEDLEVTCSSYEQGLRHEAAWRQPNFVRRVDYDMERSQRFGHLPDPVPELRRLYRESFGRDLAPDRALVLSKFMGHWPYLETMADYDVVLLSYAPIQLGLFCPKPYAILPVGGDIYISPFEETLTGVLFRGGYRAAKSVLAGTNRRSNYLYDYLPRLVPQERISYLPMLCDTDSYAPGDGAKLRSEWRERSGGSYFVVSICQWKGNDRLIRAAAALEDPGLRLVLLEWGEDVGRSKQLTEELRMTAQVIWEPLCSKPLVRERERAADVVVDQFVMTSYGAAVYESLAIAKPVIMRYDATAEDNDSAPLVNATSVAQIAEALKELKDPDRRRRLGDAGRGWILRNRGFQKHGPGWFELFSRIAS